MKEFRTEGFGSPAPVVARKSAPIDIKKILLSSPVEWPGFLKLFASMMGAFFGVSVTYSTVWALQAAQCPGKALMVGENTGLLWNEVLFPSALIFYFCLIALSLRFDGTLKLAAGAGPFSGDGAPWPQIIVVVAVMSGVIAVPATAMMAGSSYCFMQDQIVEHALWRPAVSLNWGDIYSVNSNCYFQSGKSGGEWKEYYRIILRSGTTVSAKKPKTLRADTRTAVKNKLFSQQIIWDDSGIRPGCPFPDYRRQLGL